LVPNYPTVDSETPAARPVRIAQQGGFRAAQWGVIDQALSSGTNFLMAFLVAALVAPAEFGVFSLVVILYTVTIGSCRALAGEPLVIRFAAHPEELGAASRESLGALTAIGVAVGTACCLAAAAATGPLRASLTILGLCLPLLLVQDGGRVILFARSEPKRAAANDAVWAVFQAIAVGFVTVTHQVSASAFVASWAVAGALAGLVLLLQLQQLPDLSRFMRWFGKHHDLAAPLLANYFLTTAPSYMLFALVPVVANLKELGVSRAAYLPFGAFGIVLQSAWLLLLPIAARAESPRALLRLSKTWSAGLGVLALVWTIVIVALPARMGELIMGDTWHHTGSVRLFFGGALIAYAIGVGPVIGLRAMESPRQLVWIRLAVSPPALAVGLFLAHSLGAPGVALGILLGDILTALLGWLTFARLANRPTPVEL
jgi:hypothetical protein